MQALRAILLVVMVLGMAEQIADQVRPQVRISEMNVGLMRVDRDRVRVDSLRGLRAEGDVRVGDTLAALAPSFEFRIQEIVAGTAVKFRNERTGGQVVLRDTQTSPVRPGLGFVHGTMYTVELLAIVLLALRGTSAAAIGLAAFLFFNRYSFSSDTGMFWAPLTSAWPFVQIAAGTASQIGLVTLAASFAPPRRMRRSVAAAFVAVSIVGAAMMTWTALIAFTGFYVPALTVVIPVWESLGAIVAIPLFLYASAVADGRERRRVQLIALGVITGSLDSLPSFFGPLAYTAAQTIISVALTVVMAVVLTYAILVERVFDIAFVINRAVVYAITSAVVVLGFACIEFAVGKIATQLGAAQTTLVELGAAIVIGVSLRPLHHKIDDVVDHSIFAARHRAAAAILRFADDAGEYRSPSALVAATAELLRLHARSTDVAVLLADEDGTLRSDTAVYPADHPVSVRLRTSRAPVDRGAFPQLGDVDVAFPMVRRRDLAGAIMVTLPERAEPYSPEERGAIATLAREVAAALVALEAAEAKRLIATFGGLPDRTFARSQ